MSGFVIATIVATLGAALWFALRMGRRREAGAAKLATRPTPTVDGTGSAPARGSATSGTPARAHGSYRAAPPAPARLPWEDEADRLAKALGTDGWEAMAIADDESVQREVAAALAAALGVEATAEMDEFDDLIWRARVRGREVAVSLPNAEIIIRPVRTALSLSVWRGSAPGRARDFDAVAEGLWVVKGQRLAFEALDTQARHMVHAVMPEVGLRRFSLGMDNELEADFEAVIDGRQVRASLRQVPDPVRTLARAIDALVSLADGVESVAAKERTGGHGS